MLFVGERVALAAATATGRTMRHLLATTDFDVAFIVCTFAIVVTVVFVCTLLQLLVARRHTRVVVIVVVVVVVVILAVTGAASLHLPCGIFVYVCVCIK